MPDGSFAGATAIEEADCFAAAMRGGEQMGNDDAELGTCTEIPDDKSPAEQYRNRKLTREEVRQVWGARE